MRHTHTHGLLGCWLVVKHFKMEENLLLYCVCVCVWDQRRRCFFFLSPGEKKGERKRKDENLEEEERKKKTPILIEIKFLRGNIYKRGCWPTFLPRGSSHFHSCPACFDFPMKTYGRRKDRKRGYDLPPTNTLNCHLHTQRKEKKKSVWLLATVHVGAALLGRIDNNNSREITSLVVAVEPCVQKATNPISKLFIGHSTFFRSPTIVSSSSSSSFGCCYTFWVVVVVVVVIEAGFLLGPCLALVVVTRHTHTHSRCVCVCVGEDTEQHWPTFWVSSWMMLLLLLYARAITELFFSRPWDDTRNFLVVGWLSEIVFSSF